MGPIYTLEISQSTGASIMTDYFLAKNQKDIFLVSEFKVDFKGRFSGDDPEEDKIIHV